MGPGEINKNLIQFQRTIFNNTYSAIATLQDHTVKISLNIISNLPWYPDEARKALTEAFDLYEETRENVKKNIDDTFLKLEELGFTKFEELFKAE